MKWPGHEPRPEKCSICERVSGRRCASFMVGYLLLCKGACGSRVNSDQVFKCIYQSLCVLNDLWQDSLSIYEFLLVLPVFPFFNCEHIARPYVFSDSLTSRQLFRKQMKSCLRSVAFPIWGQSPQNIKKIDVGYSREFSSVQSLSHVRLFATPWIAAHQASLSITNPQSSLRQEEKSVSSSLNSSRCLCMGGMVSIHTKGG